MTTHDPNETNTKSLKGQTVGYARVSSTSQHLDMQLDVLSHAGCERIFQEKVSGADRDRPELSAMMDYLREGGTPIVSSMDRLARSLPDLYNLVSKLTENGIEVHFIKEGQNYTRTSGPVAKLMLGLLGAVAEFERSVIRERQAEGISKVKEKGIYRGRARSLSDTEILGERIAETITLMNQLITTAAATAHDPDAYDRRYHQLEKRYQQLEVEHQQLTEKITDLHGRRAQATKVRDLLETQPPFEYSDHAWNPSFITQKSPRWRYRDSV